jgi:hypothetical protein
LAPHTSRFLSRRLWVTSVNKHFGALTFRFSNVAFDTIFRLRLITAPKVYAGYNLPGFFAKLLNDMIDRTNGYHGRSRHAPLPRATAIDAVMF